MHWIRCDRETEWKSLEIKSELVFNQHVRSSTVRFMFMLIHCILSSVAMVSFFCSWSVFAGKVPVRFIFCTNAHNLSTTYRYH